MYRELIVQCSHHILGRCKGDGCPWSKPQTIQIQKTSKTEGGGVKIKTRTLKPALEGEVTEARIHGRCWVCGKHTLLRHIKDRGYLCTHCITDTISLGFESDSPLHLKARGEGVDFEALIAPRIITE